MENDLQPAHSCHLYYDDTNHLLSTVVLLHALYKSPNYAAAVLLCVNYREERRAYSAAVRMQPVETGMAVFQFSSASVNFQRPEEVDPAQSKSSHTLPEPLSVSTAQCSLHHSGKAKPLCSHGSTWHFSVILENLILWTRFHEIMSLYVHTLPGKDCYTSHSGCIYVSGTWVHLFQIWIWRYCDQMYPFVPITTAVQWQI